MFLPPFTLLWARPFFSMAMPAGPLRKLFGFWHTMGQTWGKSAGPPQPPSPGRGKVFLETAPFGVGRQNKFGGGASPAQAGAQIENIFLEKGMATVFAPPPTRPSPEGPRNLVGESPNLQKTWAEEKMFFFFCFPLRRKSFLVCPCSAAPGPPYPPAPPPDFGVFFSPFAG